LGENSDVNPQVTFKPWWGILFGIVIGLLAAGITLLATAQPRGEPVSLLPPPTPEALIVQVSGAVSQPGIYTLPAGSRVYDAIQSAGGVLPGASEQALNLAATLQDGQWIRVALSPPDDAGASTVNPTEGQFPSSYPATVVVDHLININTANQEELESLPGIGQVLSQRIIKYRNAYGLFKTIEDINVIYGLSPETYDLIKDLITVETEPTPGP
jgi:competence protein ComEA